MKIQIIFVPHDSGHRAIRMGKGPEYFRQNKIDEVLREDGHNVWVETVESKEKFHAEIKTSFELYRILASRIHEAHSKERFPLIFSGNCGSSLGAIAEVDPAEFGIIWFDGHGDFNTPETTLTGFLDGMGLAIATGLCWQQLAGTIPQFVPISFANVIHVGGRDFDEKEKILLNQTGVTVIPAEVIKAEGVPSALKDPIDSLRLRVKGIHVHFDLDVLDPQLTPANEYAPPDGLTLREIQEAISLIGQSFQIASCGIASYDPAYDVQNHTLHAGIGIVKAVLAATTRV